MRVIYGKSSSPEKDLTDSQRFPDLPVKNMKFRMSVNQKHKDLLQRKAVQRDQYGWDSVCWEFAFEVLADVLSQ